MQRSNQLKLVLIVIFITGLVLVFEFSGLRDNFTVEFFKDKIENHFVIGSIIFILSFTLGNIIQVPGWIFLAAAVLTLGKLTGGLLTYSAAILSCTLTYFLIRFMGDDALRDLDNKIAKKLFAQLDQRPIFAIVVMRIIFQTLPVLNYSLALSRIRFKHYLIGTILGLPIPIAVYCLFFDFIVNQLL